MNKPQTKAVNLPTGAVTKGPSHAGQPMESAMMFVHSRLDDASLSPAEFRVYGHLVRRANRRVAWPGVTSMARVCRLHPQTVRKALKELVRRNMVRIELRTGETSQYYLTPFSLWLPNPGSHPAGTDTPLSNSEDTPAKPMEGTPCETNGGKGILLEGNPEKEIHSPADAGGECVSPPSLILNLLEEKAAVILEAYPRQVGCKPALQAIRRALQNVAFEELLCRTQQFGQAWAGATGAELRYCPYPANWFRDERFNDDPQTWRPPSHLGASLSVQMRSLEKLIEENERDYGDSSNYEQRRQLSRWRCTLDELRRKAAGQGTG